MGERSGPMRLVLSDGMQSGAMEGVAATDSPICVGAYDAGRGAAWRGEHV
jgi:hypothetical protein